MSTRVSNRDHLPLAANNGALARRAHLFRLPAVCGALLVACFGLNTVWASPPIMRADAILIVKHERKLYLMRDSSPLRSYRIALGLSPHRRQGTPMGLSYSRRQLHHRFSPGTQPLLQGAARFLSEPTGLEAIIRAAHAGGRKHFHSRRAEPTQQTHGLLQNARLDQRLHCPVQRGFAGGLGTDGRPDACGDRAVRTAAQVRGRATSARQYCSAHSAPPFKEPRPKSCLRFAPYRRSLAIRRLVRVAPHSRVRRWSIEIDQ